MRLLLVTGVYPTPRRPIKGTFNRDLVTGLRAAGDEVRVIAPVPWTDLLRAPRAAPAEPDVRYPTWWYPPRLDHAGHHRWMSLTIPAAARRATADWQPDLVLGYWTHPDGTVALDVAHQLAVPGVVMVGGTDVRVLTRNAARRRIIVETLARADLVLAVGDALRMRVLELGMAADHVQSFQRGVDTARFSPGSGVEARRALGLPLDRAVFLWIGRMAHVKGLDVLLTAWRDVANLPTPPLLVLIGDGEERTALARMAVPFGDSVRFVGPVAHEALARWYRAADAVVLPSRSEGVPNVLLEGLACGTPFIASEVGGVPDLLEPPSVMVPPENADALAVALRDRAAAIPLSARAQAAVPDRRDAIAALRAQLAAVIAPQPTGALAVAP
ncbi:MAG TPA: glycosyltransferase [Gemmatimonadales bacterium]|jgi:glycosyltransferase involved in cell wall biosynthesis|nr:glycosyltransferase [Gemmatimonadales bacterium]